MDENGWSAKGVSEAVSWETAASDGCERRASRKPPRTGAKSRPTVDQPEPGSGSSRKPARYSLTGTATFYDEGLTAMRLPRGTVVIVCGKAGCLQRTITDYGPQSPSRIIDMDKQDFFHICGCPSWSGTTTVTVHVY